ncbi:hypothetical protein [Propionivibrio sp.]|uniref:hypothetical protein n=1 Tax=Propionivibrio sp. TaxID=2212460 RepID=UPI003BEF66F9
MNAAKLSKFARGVGAEFAANVAASLTQCHMPEEKAAVIYDALNGMAIFKGKFRRDVHDGFSASILEALDAASPFGIGG